MSLRRALDRAKERLHEWWWARSNAARVWVVGLPARIWSVRWRPLLDVWIDVGILQIQTALWRGNYNFDGSDYVVVEVRVLRKWGFRFRLYDYAIRKMERK